MAKIAYIRKVKDIYMSELLDPISMALSVVYVLKILISVNQFIYITGKRHLAESTLLADIMNMGIQEGQQIYGPYVLELVVVAILAILQAFGLL